MNQLSDAPVFRGISTTTQTEWLSTACNVPAKKRLFIVTSGYEARNTHWIERAIGIFPPACENATYFVVGFEDFPMALSRPKNDKFYRSHDLPMESLSSEKKKGFLDMVLRIVEENIATAENCGLEVHIDYSCMPRLWYCSLPLLLETALRESDNAYFWYTPGIYPETEWPTAGVEDFDVFSGKPSLGAPFRTHLFGLGFDRIRSQAIWSIIDPQKLVCFYAAPAGRDEYVERVKNDNMTVLRAANHAFTVPLQDFVFAYSKIASIACEFRNFGDVVLVPDGPKPLILAASLVPIRLGGQGITCFHVRRRKAKDFEPVDVFPLDESVGFRFSGRRHEE